MKRKWHHGERHIYWWKIGFPRGVMREERKSIRQVEIFKWTAFMSLLLNQKFSPILTSFHAVFCFPLYGCFSVFSLADSHGNMWKIFPQKFVYTLFHWPSAMWKLIMGFLPFFWGATWSFSSMRRFSSMRKQRLKWKIKNLSLFLSSKQPAAVVF